MEPLTIFLGVIIVILLTGMAALIVFDHKMEKRQK